MIDLRNDAKHTSAYNSFQKDRTHVYYIEYKTSNMQSLSSYLRTHNQFTVGGTTSDKLLIFDVDDTLIHTTASILVMKGDKPIKKLTNAEYNDYRLKPGEWFDYSEFDDPKILRKETFTKYWDTLKREYAKGTHISILTARSIGSEIREFFLHNGIDIKPQLVFAVGDPKLGLTGSVQDRKAKIIGDLALLGYKTIVFFDDNEGNLQTAKALEKKFNIKIHAVKA